MTSRSHTALVCTCGALETMEVGMLELGGGWPICLAGLIVSLLLASPTVSEDAWIPGRGTMPG
ncbi:unnamed protein product [Periconia digitata]|uniref:Uncharacterized protein n=1 Tax=Periconia digitata TaxID=1303443 RepID=A0A9W4XV61_9PLEO|nr:unnamed protein product [Periconia digitata]